MEQNTKRKSLLFKIFACVFMLSVAVSVIPSNSIGVFGFFGEITTVAIQSENVEIVKDSHKPNLVTNHAVQRQNQNQNNKFEILIPDLEWLTLFALLILIVYTAYSISLPNAWNLINYKVRLDD